MITFQEVKYTIRNITIFKNISITILPSAIIYLTGNEKSGKTSLLRMIAGIQSPTNGRIYHRFVNKPHCAYIGHELGVNPQMTVFENLKFCSEIYDSLETLEASIHYFKLQNILDIKCYKLSKSELIKVSLSKLISCQSNIWLLDEVESNLDIDKETKDLLQNLILSKANSGGIVLITTKYGKSIESAQVLNILDYNVNAARQ